MIISLMQFNHIFKSLYCSTSQGQLAYECTTHAITQLTWIPRSEVAKQAVCIQKHCLLCKVSLDSLYCPGEFTAATRDVLAEGSVELIERWV